MKIISLSIVMALLLALSACGGGPKDSSTNTPNNTAENTTVAQNSETATAAATVDTKTATPTVAPDDGAWRPVVEDLWQRALQAAKNSDEAALAKLYRDADKATLETTMESLRYINQSYDTANFVLLAQKDNLYAIECISYIVTSGGTLKYKRQDFVIRNSFGNWAFATGADAQALYDTVMPMGEMANMLEGYNQAVAAKRNAQITNTFNYMALDETLVFEGSKSADCLALWQNEDGSVSAMLHLVNGTNQNVDFAKLKFQVTDKSTGKTICDVTASNSFTVKAMHNRLQMLNIKPKDVQTGTDAWNDFNCHLEWSNG